MQTVKAMVHPGLPSAWAIAVLVIGMLLILRGLLRTPSMAPGGNTVTLGTWPGLQRWFRNPWPQTLARVLVAALFLLAIYAGIVGTPIPERNFATVVTWNLWWSGLIILTFFAGTVWCGMCPWDSIAQWLVRRRLWRRGGKESSLDLAVPAWLRNVWPATVMFIGLTWLELGFGITRSPYGTAMVAMLMVVLATTSMALYERKAFCRYFCPVGRTLGAYAQLSMMELRPVNAQTCADCKTLDCYHGSVDIEPCPTRLVMGRFHQNTYCTSCGACVRSCPHQNVSWHARKPGIEINAQSRPHTDEAWFFLVLLALTSFHGITMMPFWEQGMSQVARRLGDSGQLLPTFTLFMLLFIVIVSSIFFVLTRLTALAVARPQRSQLFTRLAFVAIPLAFSYHMAHNLGHLLRENGGTLSVWLNPTGTGTLPFSMHEMHYRMQHIWLGNNGIYTLQALLIVGGIYFAVEILRHRLSEFYRTGSPLPGVRLLPMLTFIFLVSAFNVWLLMNPMIMRY